MIRARARADLVRMLNRLYGTQAERLKLVDRILKLDHADYQYRYKLPRREWVCYVAAMANSIDYDNVKGNIIPPDHYGLRSQIMHQVWAALLRLQEPHGRR